MLMPCGGGPCRFGQYHVLQRQILDDHGFEDVEIASPNAAASYQKWCDSPTRLKMLVWNGTVMVDLSQKLLYAHRPYELHVGQTDALYQECVQRIVADTEAGGGRRFRRTVNWMVRRFESLPTDRSRPRPIIGLVGEVYLRLNEYANQELIRAIEAAGGQVIVASMASFFYYVNSDYLRLMRQFQQPREILLTRISELYQRYTEHHLVRLAAHLLPQPYESRTDPLLDRIRPYYEPDLSTEAVLTIAEAMDMARHVASGIVHILPFSCMPGIICAGLAPQIRGDLENIPWLDVIIDTHGRTNLRTRLEAFMYQATQYCHGVRRLAC
jgi:predicted nucleotide-binding protein (sugar kinase/HSP70/actin superfamily)